MKALTRQTNDVATFGMSKWTHRATAQKTDALRRNQTRWIDREWRKKPTPISYCPELSLVSLSLSLFARYFFLFLFYPWSLLSLHANVKKAKHFSYHVWYVRATCPLKMSCRDIQRRQTIFANIKRVASIKRGQIFLFLFNVKVLEMLFFAICYFFRLANCHDRHDVKNTLYILHFRYQQNLS